MNMTARVSRLSAPGQGVAVFLVAFASIVIMGCASAPPQQQAPARQQIELPTWEDERAIAVNVIGAQPVARANIQLRRTINDIPTMFSYSGSLFNFPVRRMSDDYFIGRGLTVTEFPRQGSRDHQIMWESIRNFKQETGARPGDFFEIRVNRNMTQEEWDARRGGVFFLYFVGRIEADGGIRGSIWRRS